MRKITLPLVAAALLLAAQTGRAEKPRALEETVEAPSSAVTLPSTPEGVATFRVCRKCPVVMARATHASQYFVGDRQVSLAEVQKLAGARTVALLVSYHVADKTLTRITALPEMPVD